MAEEDHLRGERAIREMERRKRSEADMTEYGPNGKLLIWLPQPRIRPSDIALEKRKEPFPCVSTSAQRLLCAKCKRVTEHAFLWLKESVGVYECSGCGEPRTMEANGK